MAVADSLSFVLEAATEQAAQAERALAAANARERDAARQLETLATYRNEYAARQRGGAATPVGELMNLRAFIAKLDIAVAAQQAECTRLAGETAQAQAAFVEARRRMKSIELLRTRRLQEVERKLARQEQKQADEFAARAARMSRDAAEA